MTRKSTPNETSSAVAVWQWLPPARPFAFSGSYEIVNTASHLPLKVAGASIAANTPVAQGSYQGSLGALWTLVPTSGGYYQIKNAKSGLVASVAADSVQSGAKIVQRPAQGFHPGSDEWWPVHNENGTYSFYNLNSLQALDDPGAATAPGTQMDQWFANGSPAQKFTLISQKVADGSGATRPQVQAEHTRPKDQKGSSKRHRGQ